jgi:hypothetical protein
LDSVRPLLRFHFTMALPDTEMAQTSIRR